MPVDNEYSGYNPEGAGCVWVLFKMLTDIFAIIMIILHFLIRKMMTVYGIFTGYILVPINVVECIREPSNDILDVKISDP